jgi:hypothetical protein
LGVQENMRPRQNGNGTSWKCQVIQAYGISAKQLRTNAPLCYY